jgi:hypothetical protein
MNLRVQPGLAHSRPTLDATSNLALAFHSADKPPRVPPDSTETCIVLPGWNCVSNSLQGHQLEKSLYRVDLWKQVEKTKRTVDFTNVGAAIKITWDS